MALSPFQLAIQQLASERNIPEERIIDTVEAAIAAAYRRDYGTPEMDVKVKLKDSGGEGIDFDVFRVWDVVETEDEMEEPERQVMLSIAQMDHPLVLVGETVEEPLEYQSDFGRIAAQTAKQVIVQRVREAERDILYEEFKTKESMLLTGSVQQVELDTVVVSLGKVNAIMPPREQIRGEYYSTGQRIRVFVKEVAESGRGPAIIVSRSDSRFIRELFALEVPEIQAGTVEIRAISREGGSRTKMAVFSTNPAIDPVGSCVGQRGTRVQAVLNEIGDEKIDIMLWRDDAEEFIRQAMNPAKIRAVHIDEEAKNAKIEVDNDQLSLAIGRGGQNVRLASKLTGYSLDIIRDDEQVAEAAPRDVEDPGAPMAPSLDELAVVAAAEADMQASAAALPAEHLQAAAADAASDPSK